MDKEDDEFLKRINETFRIEAKEHLDAFSAGLIDLEKKQLQERHARIIEEMFREIHSLKGAARSIDQKDVETICQPLESIFSALKRNEFTLSNLPFDLIHKTLERLSKLLTESGKEQTFDERQSQRELIKQLKEINLSNLNSSVIEETNLNREFDTFEKITIPDIKKNIESDTHIIANILSTETVRVKISKLEPLLLQAEELIQSKKAIAQRITEIQEINTQIASWKSASLQFRAKKSNITNCAWNKWSEEIDATIIMIESQLTDFTSSMQKDHYNLGSLIENHLEAMLQILMLPVSTMVEIFPSMVRNISHEQNKEIEFVVSGTELEVDKRILDELKDPLIHLIRNSIDHGIDNKKERILQNKTPNGKITLSFNVHESGMFKITLSDDGKGINEKHVLKAAIKAGNITSESAEKLEQKEILSLIYQSGVSTSSFITDISGRGLGLSIVREKVEKLNGTIWMETEVNSGTTFHILLPMKIATFRGILLSVGEFMFIVPTMNVDRVIKANQENIKTVANHQTIEIDGQVLSLANLGEVLGLPEHQHVGTDKNRNEQGNINQILVVVLISGQKRTAFKVDEVMDEQQVLLKSLGKLLFRVKNISGATILGSGKVVPVLHISDLMKSAQQSSSKIKQQTTTIKIADKKKRILVTDDSITSRTLIKNILETAGYQVTTAIDGMDALTKARSDVYDLIVSDVDMPRLNGFELTLKIRQDKKLSELPVLLITALGAREDHERGIEVGANAYIIKSNFDQTNLLEIIKKLI